MSPYGDAEWGDLLTKYGDLEIEYDEIGNPERIGDLTLTWQHGRQLASLTSGETTWHYTYNADGLRTKRTDGTNTYEYVYYGGLLQYMEYNNTPVYFTHAPDGTPMGMLTGGNAYFYITNLQGDVVGIVDATGNLLVSYTYDAWGNPLSTTVAPNNTDASNIAAINPLRYRSYIYDSETGLYYLQSRCYNPNVGRFINADGYTSTGQGLVGNNVFAYCNNAPINFSDPVGTYLVPDDPLRWPVWVPIGGNATGVSTASMGGGSGGVPVPMVDLTVFDILETADIVSDTVDIVNGFGELSQAAEYGIMDYISLRKELKGTGLEAHHIVEVRFLNGKDIDTLTALSVAVTKEEHQKFTNNWRTYFPYGKQNYKELKIDEIWEAAQEIYKGYPDLLEAVWDTLY